MDDLKRLIRSIIISSPLEMEIWKLNKDYEEINGESIPHRTFGFNSLEDLLRSIPDIVEVHGWGPKAVLKVVVGSKSAHIEALVSKQRLPEPRRKRGIRVRPQRRSTARYGVPIYQQPQPLPQLRKPSLLPMPCYMPSFNPAVVPPHHMQAARPNPMSYNVPLQRNEPPPRFRPILPQQADYNNHYYTSAKCDMSPRYNHTSVPPRPSPNAASTPLPNAASAPLPIRKSPLSSPLPKTPDVSKNQTTQMWLSSLSALEKKSPVTANCLGSNAPSSPGSNGTIPKQKTNVTPQASPTKSPEVDCYYSDQDGYLSDGDYTEECPDFPQEDEYVNYNVPFAVQENLKKLITQRADGIWCADMPNIYLKMFKKPLEYSEYGYRSLIQMCMGLETIFRCHRPDNGDFLLFDKAKPMPKDVLKNLQYVSAFKAKLDYKTHELATEPAIIDAEELVEVASVDSYPPGVMKLGEEIPRQFLSDNIKENEYIDVVVGEVYDPSKFWVLLKEHSEKLDLLMDELQTFYTSFDGNVEIPEHMVKVGLYCVAKYNNEYHRAIIVHKAFEKSKIKVFYPDYGTLSTCNWKDLLYLHRKFTDLPLQAIRARLASIWPPTACSPWSLEASSRFLTLVKCKDLVAHLFRIIRDKQIVEIFLVDTSTNVDFYMNDALVQEGLALFTNQEQEKKLLHPRRIPKYKHMHFFPTFDDLEQGNALSAAEVVRLCRLGFQEEYLFPNYYIEVINEETRLNDQQFEDSQNKLFAETEKLKNKDGVTPSSSASCSAPPSPNWTELCKEEEEEIEKSDTGIRELSVSSLSEEPVSSPEATFKPAQQIFAKPAVKPPPGFEAVKPIFPFVANVGHAQVPSNAEALAFLANRVSMAQAQAQAQTILTNMLPQPSIVMTSQPINVVTQQVIDPALFLQNSKQNDLLQQVALSRMLLNVPNTWNQQVQNMLIAQQNPLLFAQQQNPFVFQQPNPVMVPQQPTQWNNPNQIFQQPNTFVKQQLPAANCLDPEQRKLLQKCVQRHLINGNRDLLCHLGNMLKSQSDKKEGLLFKLVCEILLNRPTTVLLEELELVITNLLDLLVDCQIIDLATRQLESGGQGDNVTTPSTYSNNPVNDAVVKLMSQTSISSQDPSNGLQNWNHVKNELDPEVKANIEMNHIGRNRRLVVKTELEDKPIHVIQFKGDCYVPVDDILQFTIKKPKIDVIRKLVVMADPRSSIMDIRLNEHKELAEELSRYNICEATIHVVPVTFIPNMTGILGSNEITLKGYKNFLKTVDVKSDS